MPTNSRARSTMQERVKWLVDNPQWLDNVAYIAIVTKFKEEGLLSPKSYYWDCLHGVETAVRLAKDSIAQRKVKGAGV